MFIKLTRAAVIAGAMMLPVAMQAQRGGGMGREGAMGRMGGMGGMGMGRVGGGPGGNPVAPLIDMRRELNLSARQLTQLDSIERTLLQRNQTLRDRMRTRLDSVRPRQRPSGEEEIQRFRAEGDSLRALRQLMVRNDSVARVAAMNVLTDSQRVRVRERQAERRGFAEGRMSARRGGARGFRGGRGMDGIGPRMRRGAGGGAGARGRMGGLGGPGLRPPGGMRGPGGVAPQLNDRRQPDDMPMRRFRRPPVDDTAPGNQGFAPRRGQMDDSTRFDRRPARPPVDSRQ